MLSPRISVNYCDVNISSCVSSHHRKGPNCPTCFSLSSSAWTVIRGPRRWRVRRTMRVSGVFLRSLRGYISPFGIGKRKKRSPPLYGFPLREVCIRKKDCSPRGENRGDLGTSSPLLLSTPHKVSRTSPAASRSLSVTPNVAHAALNMSV